MYQLVYDERETNHKGSEIYILYYKDKIYYSPWLLNPVKIEINRDKRDMYINNLKVEKEDEKDFARKLFKFILQMKEALEIDGYIMRNETSSSQYYIETYGNYI